MYCVVQASHTHAEHLLSLIDASEPYRRRRKCLHLVDSAHGLSIIQLFNGTDYTMIAFNAGLISLFLF